MDLTNLENALNNGDFKEQVYRSLEGIYQISNVLNQLDFLKNFGEHNSEIEVKIEALKSKLAGYETSEQELKAKINALVDSLEALKQELEARLNTQLQSVGSSENQKLNDTGNELKTQIIAEITQAKNNLKKELEALNASIEVSKSQTKGILKFLGCFVYGEQILFKNESDTFIELFEISNINLQADKSYIVQFSMPLN